MCTLPRHTNPEEDMGARRHAELHLTLAVAPPSRTVQSHPWPLHMWGALQAHSKENTRAAPNPKSCGNITRARAPQEHQSQHRTHPGTAPMEGYTCQHRQRTVTMCIKNLASRHTKCKHIGTRPPTGMGSLRDCAIVHRGNTGKSKRNTQVG